MVPIGEYINKYMNVGKGQEVPLCCGREMETMN